MSFSTEKLAQIGNWEVTGSLGDGSFSTVKAVQNVETQQKAAMKVVDVKYLAKISRTGKTVKQMRERVLREINILRKLKHKNIAALIDVISLDDTIFIVMELAEGGELFDFVVSSGRLSEELSRKYFRQLVSALEYCHGNFIIHRDLKLENILMDEPKRNLKLVDFGLSNIVTPGKLLETHCGSYQYTAPEVMMGEGYVGPASDMWSAGIILYAMVLGSLPFVYCGEDWRKILRAAQASEFFMDSSISAECQDLLLQLLAPDPYERIHLQEVRYHPWVNEGYLEPPKCCLEKFPPQHSTDPDLIAKLCYFGLKPSVVVKKLKTGERCQEVAMYHHLLQKKREKESEHTTAKPILRRHAVTDGAQPVVRRKSCPDSKCITEDYVTFNSELHRSRSFDQSGDTDVPTAKKEGISKKKRRSISAQLRLSRIFNRYPSGNSSCASSTQSSPTKSPTSDSPTSIDLNSLSSSPKKIKKKRLSMSFGALFQQLSRAGTEKKNSNSSLPSSPSRPRVKTGRSRSHEDLAVASLNSREMPSLARREQKVTKRKPNTPRSSSALNLSRWQKAPQPDGMGGTADQASVKRTRSRSFLQKMYATIIPSQG